jgi:putative transcriptional regulator
MTIKINLDEVLNERNMSSVDLANAIGITKANLSILKTGKAKAIRFSTLERICDVLDCQPGDLLSYEKNSN